MPQTSNLLRRTDAMLLVIDVQERINAVMVDQGHLDPDLRIAFSRNEDGTRRHAFVVDTVPLVGPALFQETDSGEFAADLSSEVAADLQRLTEDHLGERLAILVEGEVVATPVIQEAVTASQVVAVLDLP